jgi:hypothetical protein
MRGNRMSEKHHCTPPRDPWATTTYRHRYPWVVYDDVSLETR